jgi:hypothetical protein
MFIDIHGHFLKSLGFPRNGKPAFSTPEQLIERYDRLNIEKALVLPLVNPECAYASQSNEEVLEVAEKTGRFIPFCNVTAEISEFEVFRPFAVLLGGNCTARNPWRTLWISMFCRKRGGSHP